MSALSFCLGCVDQNKIPLESIAKFFYGQRVGIVSWIDVVEYIEVSINGALPQENLRRLYVHFLYSRALLERSELFTQQLSLGNNVWKIGGIETDVCVEISINANSKHTEKNEDTTYSFTISKNLWPGTFDNSKKWEIYEIANNKSITYNNLHEDKYKIFEYLEKNSFQDPLIVEQNLAEGEIEIVEKQERRVDLWNPICDYTNKYTTHSGAIAFTKEEYKTFYGANWKHYWNDSMEFEEFCPILHYSMTLNISITIGPFLPPHSNATTLLIVPIRTQMYKIQDIYNSYLQYNDPKLEWMCNSDIGKATYIVANMQAQFIQLYLEDYLMIKNILLDIEQMCEILKPKDIYNSMPETRIYINIE